MFHYGSALVTLDPMSTNWELQNMEGGHIEVITGCMFSGKTEELIRQLKRAHLARKKFQLFKPTLDNRYSTGDLVVSHSQQKLPSISVEEAKDILPLIKTDTQVVGIDEAQFFSADIVDVVEGLADLGIHVLLAGLDTDWQGRPFHPMPQLLAIADVIHKKYAVCTHCGKLATRTQRLVSSNKNILVGAGEVYQARCRKHFDPFYGVNKTQTSSEGTAKASAPSDSAADSPLPQGRIPAPEL